MTIEIIQSGTKVIEIIKARGDKGETGPAGQDGLSAYQVAVAGGFVGTEAQWLASLQGDVGADGQDGLSAYEIAVQNGYIGTEAQWLLSLKGDRGDKGDDGQAGADGVDGQDGLSAYEIAVINGYVGTDAQWLLSLKGDKGDKGDKGETGEPGPSGQDTTAIDDASTTTTSTWSSSKISTQLGTKLDASSYTAADILTKLKTVDGAGSGIDADTLDGISSAGFATATHTHTKYDVGLNNVDNTADITKTVSKANQLANVRTISATGDANWSVSFDGSANVSTALTLVSTGVVAGTYNDNASSMTPFTVDSKGRITSIGNAVVITPSWNYIIGKPTTVAGYGITDALSTSHATDYTLHLTSTQNTWIDAITATSTEVNRLVGVTSGVQSQLDGKQSTLVSGTNIKTINGNSILGAGDIVITGGTSLPTQTGNSGKFLTTDGTNASWGTVVIDVIDDSSTTSTSKSWSASKINTIITSINNQIGDIDAALTAIIG